jgi:hypothetical protein
MTGAGQKEPRRRERSIVGAKAAHCVPVIEF